MPIGCVRASVTCTGLWDGHDRLPASARYFSWVAIDASEILRSQWLAACDRVIGRLDHVSDDEFFWEPVPNCWTVHRRSDPPRAAGADGSGEWVIDYEIPEPEPAPFTTIAWRIVHVAAVNYLYFDYAFGTASLSFDLEMPGSATDAVAWLKASQAQLTAVISELAEDDLEELTLTNWGERWPCERIWRTLIDEQVHHGAEVSLLRDLRRLWPRG